MAFPIDLPDIVESQGLNGIIWASIVYVPFILFLIIIWIITSKKKKRIDVSALAALASSDAMNEDAAPNADPKEVISILQIERVAASTALSAVKDAQKSKRISASVSDSLMNRYKARIAKIDSDIKRRSGAQEYRSLAESLEQSRDKIRDEVMPGIPTPPPPSRPTSISPPQQSSTPGIPPTAPPVPGIASPPFIPPTISTPTSGIPPTKPSSPIPTPPKIPPMSPTTRPSTVVPPSVAPPTISTPPLPPKIPSTPSITPPTTTNMAPPPVPTSIPTTSLPPPTTADSDSQSISGLRMEMLRELARLKKFMSEETQQ